MTILAKKHGLIKITVVSKSISTEDSPLNMVSQGTSNQDLKPQTEVGLMDTGHVNHGSHEDMKNVDILA